MSARVACWTAALACALGCVCCTKKEPPHRTEPWLATPSASSQLLENAPRSFHFLPDSSVRFSSLGRKGKVSGRVPLSQGKLSLDAHDLKTTKATLDADLTKLSIDTEVPTEGAELGGSSPNALALQWLELGADIAAERRAEFATARFELASVEDTSASFVDFSARQRAHVRATAVGTLLIHGFREPVRAEVVLEPVKTAPGAPLRLSIRSALPLVVALAPHDITARGPSGIVDALGMARAKDWVGKNVRVEFELIAEADAGAATVTPK